MSRDEMVDYLSDWLNLDKNDVDCWSDKKLAMEMKFAVEEYYGDCEDDIENYED